MIEILCQDQLGVCIFSLISFLITFYSCYVEMLSGYFAVVYSTY